MSACEMLESFTPELFWDVDVKGLHPRTHARFIIRRVLERGTRKQVDSIHAFYSRETIRDALVTARSLDPKTLSYFAAVFEIPLHEFRAFREPAQHWEPSC